jgi:hypothetical protein
VILMYQPDKGCFRIRLWLATKEGRERGEEFVGDPDGVGNCIVGGTKKICVSMPCCLLYNIRLGRGRTSSRRANEGNAPFSCFSSVVVCDSQASFVEVSRIQMWVQWRR